VFFARTARRNCLGANFDFYLNFWRNAKLREYRKRLIGVCQKQRMLQKWIVVTIWPVCFLPRSPDEHAVISEYEKRRDRNSVVLLTVDPQKQAQTPQTAQTTSYSPRKKCIFVWSTAVNQQTQNNPFPRQQRKKKKKKTKKSKDT
jgi:hypothetical protein